MGEIMDIAEECLETPIEDFRLTIATEPRNRVSDSTWWHRVLRGGKDGDLCHGWPGALQNEREATEFTANRAG